MQRSLFVAIPCALLVGAVAFSCGSSNGSLFPHLNGGDASTGDDGSSSGGCGLFCGEGGGGSSGGNPGPCQGLQCAAADCSGKGTETTLSGTVYDPAGNLPLYNVYVYVPNGTPSPIVPGDPTCTPCEAPASGSPIIGAATGPDGTFKIVKGASDAWGVPAGTNGGKGIPLVIQTGKWRKQIVIPNVAACANNDLDAQFNAGSGTARQLRLPAKSSEGDMPLMAFTSGCDPAECFLRHMGIDDSEFVPPGAPVPAAFPATTPGAGHVHFYTAQDNQNGPSGSAVTGGNTAAQTYQWWTDSKNLLQYDIVFNACECNPNDRGAGSYAAMDAYLQGGGRLFTTHYYGNWFVPTTGTPDLQSVASWASIQPGGWQANPSQGSEDDAVDQSFPKGAAYAQWLQDNAISTSLGNITLSDVRDDILAPKPAGCAASGSCLSTQWIYNPGNNHPRYLSFNTPVGTPVAQQCGRAVYSDVHLSGVSDDSTFPAECSDPAIDSPPGHAINEKALEFLFFDLSSCVQNDTQPPPPPNPTQ
ncbi:MAG TPA: hypothetical protein VGG39_17500 [Polyangiaceae bacterium]|jgi:hypothetical protein